MISEKKRLFIKANGFDFNDPLMDKFNEETGDLNIPKKQQIQLAKGLYRYPNKLFI